ncbi:MAG: flagellin [Planctomycetota bacterium]|nr:flagellin [Planctomycetota bacterium]
MTSIPSGFDRVPTRLSRSLTQRGISEANAQILRAQVQLSSSKRVLRPSDDPIAASLINVIDRREQLAQQRERNLQHAASALGTLDQALDQLNESLQEAREIASSQVGVGSDAGTRRSQAVVVQSLLDSAVQTLNRDFAGLHLFGGERTGRPPIERFHGGYRYVGGGEGLFTDLGDGERFPITIGADDAAGALSARVTGSVDLNPALTAATRISDLRGPSGEISSLSTISVTINDGTPVTVDVDLSAAQTAGDVALAIESAIRAADPAALGGVYPSAVGFTGERLSLGSVNAGYTITFADGPTGGSATALGLAGFSYDSANPTNTDPLAVLDPVVTERTALGDLAPGTALTYGSFTITNGSRSGTVTTNAGMTVAQLREAIDRLDLGVRLEIGDTGRSLNLINEVSGFKMSVAEVGGGTAAETLGLRTLSTSTPLSAFNHGRGVSIADGATLPGGGPDPNRNVDFTVTLVSGATFDVDLVPSDLDSVQALLTKINADATAAGFGGVFTAALNAAGTGIEFVDSSVGAGQTRVTSRNGYAASDLGLLDGSYTAGSPARLVGSNRSTVRVDSALTALVELRDSLERDDALGITFAGEAVELRAEQAIQARSIVGGRAARIEIAQERLEDTSLLDKSIKSDLQDLDYIEATTRFSLLSTQLQAGLQSAAAITSLTLLNYLR